jgi:hypothetical protein
MLVQTRTLKCCDGRSSSLNPWASRTLQNAVPYVLSAYPDKNQMSDLYLLELPLSRRD